MQATVDVHSEPLNRPSWDERWTLACRLPPSLVPQRQESPQEGAAAEEPLRKDLVLNGLLMIQRVKRRDINEHPLELPWRAAPPRAVVARRVPLRARGH